MALPARNNPLGPGRIGRTLVDKLVPIVDRIRQIPTDFGVRPYRCFLVLIRWTGARANQGRKEVVSRVELLPTPKIVDTTRESRDVTTGGVAEVGGVTLHRVSLRFTEDQILGRGPDGTKPANENTYIEVVEDGSVTPTARRRLYMVRNVPMLKRGGVHWIVPLERKYEELKRDGDPLASF